MKLGETQSGLANIDQSSHAISCLSLLLRFTGSYASGGLGWSDKDVSAFGAAVVWASLEIEHHTDVIDAARESVERNRPDALK